MKKYIYKGQILFVMIFSIFLSGCINMNISEEITDTGSTNISIVYDLSQLKNSMSGLADQMSGSSVVKTEEDSICKNIGEKYKNFTIKCDDTKKDSGYTTVTVYSPTNEYLKILNSYNGNVYIYNAMRVIELLGLNNEGKEMSKDEITNMKSVGAKLEYTLKLPAKIVYGNDLGIVHTDGKTITIDIYDLIKKENTIIVATNDQSINSQEIIKNNTVKSYIFPINKVNTGMNLFLPSSFDKNISVSNLDFSSFKDIFKEDDRVVLQRAVNRGWIKGYDDSTFRPNNEVNRAEFAKMLTVAFNKPLSDNNNYKDKFKDWSVGAWYENVLSTMIDLGIISGYKDGNVKPNNSVSQAEAIKMVIKTSENSVEDNKIGNWYEDYYKHISKLKLINEKNKINNDSIDFINMNDNNKKMTRLECVYLIDFFLNYPI